MKFSIIVPIYNVSQYLNECLESIQNQTFGDFECVLVDDGSTDNSSAICDSFVDRDPRFLVIHKENGGLVSARKAGAEASSGDYIFNVDGDDYIKSDMLKTMADIIEQHNPEAVYFGCQLFGGNINHRVFNACSTGLYEGSEIDRLRHTYLYDPNSIGINSGTVLFNIWAKCIRRTLYVQCQEKVPNDIVSGEDTVFTMCLSRVIKRVYVSDYCGYCYRQNNASIEHQFSLKNFEKLYRVYETLMSISCDDLEMQNAVNVYLFYRAWFYCCGIAIYSKTYRDFLSTLKQGYDSKKMRDVLSIIRIKSPNMQSTMKLNLLKYRKWFTIYLLSKIYFRKKLEL